MVRQPLVLLLLAAAAAAQSPNPVYDASSYSSTLRTVPNGVLYLVSAPEQTELRVMHLFGD